jgi:hypothetical protein
LAKKEAADAEQRRQKATNEGEHLVADRFADAVVRWNRVAELWLKAAKLAQQAALLEQETLKLETKARQARTLVEQTEARRARALGELRRLDVHPVAPTKQPITPDSATKN